MGRPRRTYTLEDKERGLLAVAVYDGNTRKAAADLEARGTPIPRDTLRHWKDANPDKLAEIRTELLPQIRERQAAECEETATLAGEVEREGIERLHEMLPEIPLRDLAGAVRNLSVTKGINLEHAGKLRGDPALIVEHRHTVDEDLAWLARAGVIPSTAEELPIPLLPPAKKTEGAPSSST